MKICQDISQEMAKVQSVIDQFKELAEKVAKAGGKEGMNKLQSEFAGLKKINLDECIKLQQKLKALSMNFQRELERELELGEGKLSKKIEFDSNGYLIKLSVDNSDINLSEIDFSKTKIVEFNFRGNKGTKNMQGKFLPKNLQKFAFVFSVLDISETDLSQTQIERLDFDYNKSIKSLQERFLPKTLKILNCQYSSIDISDTDLSNTKILELNLKCNKGTKTLKTEFLPLTLEKTDFSYSKLDIFNTNLSEMNIPEINLCYNNITKNINFEFLPKILEKIIISNSTLLFRNEHIVEKLTAFFKKRNQKVEIIYK